MTRAEIEAEIAAKYRAAVPEWCWARAKDIGEKYAPGPDVMAALTEDVALAIFLANPASHTAVWHADLLKEAVVQLRASESTYAWDVADKIKQAFRIDEN